MGTFFKLLWELVVLPVTIVRAMTGRLPMPGGNQPQATDDAFTKRWQELKETTATPRRAEVSADDDNATADTGPFEDDDGAEGVALDPFLDPTDLVHTTYDPCDPFDPTNS